MNLNFCIRMCDSQVSLIRPFTTLARLVFQPSDTGGESVAFCIFTCLETPNSQDNDGVVNMFAYRYCETSFNSLQSIKAFSFVFTVQ